MKIKVRGTPDEIETIAYALRSGNYVRSVEVSQVYKANAAHKTGWAWITIVFSEIVPSRAAVEIYSRNRRRRVQNGKRATDGYVYLVKAVDGSYKIGKTVNPKSRKRTFDVRLPFKVEYVHVIQTDDMGKLEKALHTRFAAKRLSGSEFFALDDADVQFILSLGDTFEAARCANW